MTISASSSAQQTENYNFNCLSRDQREQIDICFMENLACHKQVKDLSSPAKLEVSFESLILTGLLGIVSGMVINQQIRR